MLHVKAVCCHRESGSERSDLTRSSITSIPRRQSLNVMEPRNFHKDHRHPPVPTLYTWVAANSEIIRRRSCSRLSHWYSKPISILILFQRYLFDPDLPPLKGTGPDLQPAIRIQWNAHVPGMRRYLLKLKFGLAVCLREGPPSP
jgi:hypothetical protein